MTEKFSLSRLKSGQAEGEAISDGEERGIAAELRRLINVLGPMPWTFVSVIRALVNDHQQGKPVFGPEAEFQIRRMLKSPTLSACLYYFLKSFYEDRLPADQKLAPLQLARLLEPLSLAAVLGMSYVFKRVRRICPKDQWEFLREAFEKNCALAVEIGKAVPAIGAGRALLGEGALHAALGAFLAVNPGAFRVYRRDLKKRKMLFDAVYERKHWKHSSPELAALIITSLGFGNQTAAAFEKGFGQEVIAQGPIGEGESSFELLNIAMHLALDYGGRAGRITGSGAEELKTVIKSKIDGWEALLSDRDRHNWMDRGKEDASSDKMPELVSEEPASAAATVLSEELAADVPAEETPPDGCLVEEALPVRSRYADLPETIRAEVSEAEFKQLEHMTVEEIVSLFG